MFGIGGFELFIIIVFIFVVFGPDKLPQVTKLAGRGIKKFRKAKAEMDKVVKEEIVDPVMEEANKPDDAPKEK
ncbi:MAG: twin-arginine translocase TatA/TatE family subunit [Coriobacteriia bacterium]|nr:twin-arginine translocase TatA/TatE family subunit [Coriobacteriia bacterium]